MDTMYRVPSDPTVLKCIITKDSVDKTAEPVLLCAEDGKHIASSTAAIEKLLFTSKWINIPGNIVIPRSATTGIFLVYPLIFSLISTHSSANHTLFLSLKK